MQEKDYDTTMARIAGNLLSGRYLPGDGPEKDQIINAAVDYAHRIVSEVKRRRAEGPRT